MIRSRKRKKKHTVAPVHIKKKFCRMYHFSIFTVKHPTVLVMNSNNNNSGNRTSTVYSCLSAAHKHTLSRP